MWPLNGLTKPQKNDPRQNHQRQADLENGQTFTQQDVAKPGGK
jgi:hypothetical protein